MKSRFGMNRVPALAAMLAAGTVLTAQVNTGALAGSVKDPAGNPIAGVRVSVSSPALFQPRVLTTSAAGDWVAPLLPPGTYKVTISKDGWVGSEASNLRVGIGTNFRQDLTMRPMAAAQGTTVEVVASAGEVDKTDTKAGANFSADTLATLPSSGRGFSGAADLAPGLVGAAGSYSIRGGTSMNTRYTVNGSDVKDDYQGQLTGTFYIEDNVEDVQVILSPLNARNGRSLGGTLNVVTKTGGNDFHGSIRGQVLRNGWYGLDRDFRNGDTDQVSDTLRRDYQITFNGPIIKDRLWFAVATTLQPQQADDYQITNPYNSASDSVVMSGNSKVDGILLAGPNGYGMTNFDTNKYYKRVSDSKYYEGKITGAISADHTVELAYSYSKNTLAPRNPFGDGGSYVGRLAALGEQREEKKVLGLNYRGIFSATTFLEARYNKVDSDAFFPWGDPNYGTGEGMIVYRGYSDSPGVRAGLTVPFGFGITPTPDSRNNRSGNVNLKMFREFAGGNHEIDLGYDYYESVRGTSSASGARNLYFRVGGVYEKSGQYLFPTINGTGPNALGQDGSGTRGPAPAVQQYYGADGTTRNRMDALYINDQWTVNNHLNVMLGVRYDMLKVTDTDGRQIGKNSDFSPRLQIGYDIKGDSRHLVTFSAARFAGDFTTNFTDAFIKKANTAYVVRQWGGNKYADGSLIAPGAANDPLGLFGVRFVDYKTLTDLANYAAPFTFDDRSKTNWVDGSIKAPYMEELSLAYRRQWENGSMFKATYVYRTWKDDWALATDYALENFQVVGDPSGTFQNKFLVQATKVGNNNDLKRRYQNLELEWKMPLNSIWALGGNWTYSRLVGNHNGGQQTGSSFRDNSPSGLMYERNHLSKDMGLSEDQFAPYGALNTDVPHRGRFYVSANLPLGKGNISYAWMLSYQSGSNYDLATSSKMAPYAAITNAPYPLGTPAPTTWTQYFGGRGQYRNNDTWQVDFKVNFNVPLNIWKVMLIGDVMVNNVFNQSMEYGKSHAYYNGGSGSPRNFLFLDNPGRYGTTPNTQSGDNFWLGGRSIYGSLGIRF